MSRTHAEFGGIGEDSTKIGADGQRRTCVSLPQSRRYRGRRTLAFESANFRFQLIPRDGSSVGFAVAVGTEGDQVPSGIGTPLAARLYVMDVELIKGVLTPLTRLVGPVEADVVVA